MHFEVEFALADFDTWQHLLAQSDQRAEQLIAHEQELDRLQAELAAINQQQLSLVDQLNALRQAQMRLDDEHNGIVTMRNQREDRGQNSVIWNLFPTIPGSGSHQNAGYPIYPFARIPDR